MKFILKIINHKHLMDIKKFKWYHGRSICCIIRQLSTKGPFQNIEIKNLRNIGIMAHIDAGKTTTTERMLFYGGYTNIIGEVHDGNTVMDYMDQERDRGITITSAAISFGWKNYQFNLIDTPGHVDFTMEVERALRVIDGAIAVFDASAGVEAQSMTIWLQADRYNLPRICFLNKMDKGAADFDMCLRDIENKFKIKTLPVQIPVGQGKNFSAIVDLVNMDVMDWTQSKSNYGKDYEMYHLSKELNEELWEESVKKRASLVEDLADLDNGVAEVVLEKESTNLVPSLVIREALRRVTISKSAVPVYIGSAYKNMGVQPLMDAVGLLLPCPVDRIFPGVELYGSSLCAVAFKIVHHKRHGIMTFLRVYSGSILQGKKIYNANKEKYEKVTKLFAPFADEFEEVSMGKEGSILVVTGLRFTVTGDTLVQSEESFEMAEAKMTKTNQKDVNPKQTLVGIDVPEPVFMCSIEAPSLSQQKALDVALQCLQKEDPSLRVKVDEDNGQTVLAGMGELHLSIIKDRICREYKVEAELGPLIISYREALLNYEKRSVVVKKHIGETLQEVELTLSLEPCEGYKISSIEFAHSKENSENLQSIKRVHLEALKRGISSSLLCGPVLKFPVIDVKPKLHWLRVGRKTADTFVAAIASQCVQEILRNSETTLMEPIMKVEIVVPEHKLTNLLADLAKRRAQINSVGLRQDYRIIDAVCPLADLVGFSSSVRLLSSGLANLSLEFAFHRRMNDEERATAVASLCGSFS